MTRGQEKYREGGSINADFECGFVRACRPNLQTCTRSQASQLGVIYQERIYLSSYILVFGVPCIIPLRSATFATRGMFSQELLCVARAPDFFGWQEFWNYSRCIAGSEDGIRTCSCYWGEWDMSSQLWRFEIQQNRVGDGSHKVEATPVEINGRVIESHHEISPISLNSPYFHMWANGCLGYSAGVTILP